MHAIRHELASLIDNHNSRTQRIRSHSLIPRKSITISNNYRYQMFGPKQTNQPSPRQKWRVEFCSTGVVQHTFDEPCVIFPTSTPNLLARIHHPTSGDGDFQCQSKRGFDWSIRDA